MKNKLEATASVAVIVVALAVGYVVLGRYISEYRARPVAAGDRFATIPNLDWQQHAHTLVLALNTGCHFCIESVPFYQMLSNEKDLKLGDTDVIAVFPNDPAQVRQFVAEENLRVRSLAAVPLDRLHVNGTPTLILVDRNGRVERTWIGMLDSPQQVELLKLVFALAPPVQAKN